MVVCFNNTLLVFVAPAPGPLLVQYHYPTVGPAGCTSGAEYGSRTARAVALRADDKWHDGGTEGIARPVILRLW